MCDDPSCALCVANAHLRAANHRYGVVVRELAEARAKIADLDAHVLYQRKLIAQLRKDPDAHDHRRTDPESTECAEDSQ